VIVCARSQVQVNRCVTELPGAGHDGLVLDAGSVESWEIATTSGALENVDGVVTAAALLPPVGPIGTYSAEAFWETLRVNVLGTFLPIQACLESLRSSGGAVVTFAGGGATSPQPRYDAYATSKAAVVRLSENLALELAHDGVRVNTVSPGFVATDIHAATLQAGPDLAGEGYFASTERQLDAGATPARRAAQLTAFLLSDAAAGITGKLISAPWDPWEDPAFQGRLRAERDLATLRRIDDQFFAPLQRDAGAARGSLGAAGVKDDPAKDDEVGGRDDGDRGQVDHLRRQSERARQQ
jgi:NAD(P)-dependent dehydrogenase (short-subunit alcohol dehydrogenase family)